MATAKQSPKKEETPVIPITNYDSYIMYEETMTTVKIPGEPRYRVLQRIPYIEYGEHKVYLSQSEVDGIKKGKLDPQKLLDDIPVMEVYRNE